MRQQHQQPQQQRQQQQSRHFQHFVATYGFFCGYLRRVNYKACEDVLWRKEIIEVLRMPGQQVFFISFFFKLKLYKQSLQKPF